MKNIVRELILLGWIGSVAFAAPFLAIGDNAELFVTGSAGVRYDSNILLAPSSLSKSDVIAQFAPGLSLEFGKNALVKGSLTAQETLNAYNSHSQFNNQLGSVAGTAAYDNGKLKVGADASYAQLDQNTYALNGTNNRRSTSSVGVNGELSVSDKTSIGSGLTYSETSYQTAGNVDDKTYGVPVNVYYGITPKVDLSAGVSYRKNDLSNGDSYDDYYYNVGARGSFTPKLDGNLSVGYNQRKGSGLTATNDSGLGLQTGLTYLYSEKTRFSLSASRDFSNGASGASQQATAVTLGGQTDIAAEWKANASVTYRKVDYQTKPARTDDYVQASVGATYVINSNLSLDASYLFRGNDSNVHGVAFSDNIVSLSVSARY